MKKSFLVYGIFLILSSLVLWAFGDRTLGLSLECSYGFPLVLPALLLVGFWAEYLRNNEDSPYRDGRFSSFMKHHWLTYAGLVGLLSLGFWIWEGFGAIPYVLFFGSPFYLAAFGVTCLIAILSYFWSPMGALWVWFWVGFVFFYIASISTAYFAEWAGILFCVPLVVPTIRMGLALLRVIRNYKLALCAMAGALFMAYWYIRGLNQLIPIRLPEWAQPVALLIVVALVLGAIYVHSSGWIRTGMVLIGKGVKYVALIAASIALSVGSFRYVYNNIVWSEVCHYKVIVEVNAFSNVIRKSGVVHVDEKNIGMGGVPAGTYRIYENAPTILFVNSDMSRVLMEFDRDDLATLPQRAVEAFEQTTGKSVSVGNGPIELVGEAMPALKAIPATPVGPIEPAIEASNSLKIIIPMGINPIRPEEYTKKGGHDLVRIWIEAL